MTASTKTPKVTVVVPAYNSGPHIEKLVTSLLGQSLPAGEFEVMFVDDGSTDSTGARLDELAAAHPHFRVLHIDNSGWPSRPRNLGVEHARGEYVFFADDDDWFGEEALERLYACATGHDADLVVGKMAGHRRSVPRELFRRNRFDATLENSPLIDSLTAHKLFRRSFLVEHDLRFPEGKRRLEDHVFVTRAFFLSRRTCVLADYVCYHHQRRVDAGNVTATALEPAGYFVNLREALDIVDAHTEPGPLRDRLHRRWLRNEMVSRLRGRRLLDAPADWVDQLVGEAQRTIRDRFAPGVAAGLPPLQRIITRLIEQGRTPDLRRLAEWEAAVRAVPTVQRVERDATTLTVTLTAELSFGDRPLTLTADGEQRLLVVPVDDVPADLRDATTRIKQSKLDVIARRRDTREEFFVPVTGTVELVPAADGMLRLVQRGTARLDVGALNGGRSRGTWDLKARVTCCGWTEDAVLPVAFRCAADGARPVSVPYLGSLRFRLRRAVARRVPESIRRVIRR
ncbi:glycosyltransferase family 2 protein [Micromonospora sp. HM134]|uniref:glycosyltransferase family 2 protein n=1 Tax=unclassified Micromonospora TaxID=2617518 RepID=UPI0011985868|nr:MULTISPECIES: glycosyltransferase family A protein [unclassified Micromonospora]QDY06276.1 glycosyltransferase family 2 protein [Micromonospora sp. HM134]